MKKINRRYKRSIRSNLSFYISSIVLTVVALLMYFVFSMSGREIKDFTDDFFAEHNVEDAEFITYLDISDEDIEEIEDEFNLSLEKQEYFDFEENDFTARIFKRNEKINLYEIIDGEDTTVDDEIIISKGYAENKGVNIGDTLLVNGKDYVVTGFFERPDYLYMIQNTTDSAKNVESFFISYVSDEEFESLGDSAYLYTVRFYKDNSSDFRKYINDEYKIVTYLKADDNNRISKVVTQPDVFISISYFMLILITCVVVAMISTIIGRMVKREQKLIGTLMAFGYSKGILVKHYAGFAVIPGIIGSIIAIIIVSLSSQTLGSACLADYEPIAVEFKLRIFEIMLGIAIPTLMYLFAASCAVLKLVKKNTVLLLTGNSDEGKKKVNKLFVKSKIDFRKKFALRSILSNKSRSFVVLLGIFLGGFVVMFGLAFMDSLKSIVTLGGSDIGSFEYEYVMNYIMTEERDDAEPAIITSFETLDGSSFYFMGISEDNEYIKIDDVDGKRLSLGEDDCIMTSLAAKVYGVEAGDEFSFRDANTLEKHKVKITGISQNSFQKCIYLTMENARKELDWKSNWYNTLQTDKKLNIDENDINFIVTKDSIKQQMETIVSSMNIMVYLLVFLGALCCISAIYVTVNMLVEENSVNISMLKVLGYHKKEINKIILNVNNILLIIGIVLSIPCAYGLASVYYESMADSLGCIIPTVYNPVSIIITIIVVFTSYYVSLWGLKSKVYKIDMVESMKDHRE